MDPFKWKQIKDALASAMELSGSDRSAFLEALAGDVRVEVERLLSADERAKDFISKPIIVERSLVDQDGIKDPAEGTVIDGYRLIRKIGSGGMGAVYLAEQSGDGYTQTAALKLIKRGMDTGAVLKRFLMERQILANLEHSNIARMLDGGSTEDGVPYFVMEYVDGAEIRRFCDDNRFGLDDRLGLFRKVCGAVSNAHQKLVVHRDLKPSNILVTKDSEPKLLDFGIAKLLSPDWNTDTNEATLTQFRVMTPEYASPEQIAGEPTSTSTDIYSLGVILYELLTGRKPYDTRGKAPQELVESVLSKEPPRPSTVGSGATSGRLARTDRDNDPATDEISPAQSRIENAVDRKLLQGDLDNIILKALRREPERRYQSVQEFSEDIRRFQDGLPVSATADSRSYRFQKFFKRHKAGVIGGSAAAVLLLGATGVTGWQYTVAEQERVTAERRFDQVRELARNVIFEYYDGISPLAGSLEVRKKMVEDATHYLDTLAAERSNDAALKREIADAYQRIGDVRGNVFQSSNLGDVTGAHESYLRSHAIWTELYAAAPDEPKNLLGIRRAYLKLGEILWSLGRHEEAKVNVDKALEFTRLLDEKGIPQDRAQVFDVYNRSSQVREQLWDLDGALELQSTVIAMTEEDLRNAMESTPAQKAFGAALARAGDILYRKGQYADAGDFFARSLSLFRKVLESDPTKYGTRVNLALILARRGAAACGAEDFNTCRSNNEESLVILREIERTDPADLDTKLNIATISGNLANSLCNLGEDAKCLDLYKEALKGFEQLVSKSDYAYAKANFATSMIDFAELLKARGRHAEARSLYEKAVTALSSQDESSVDDEDMARAFFGLGETTAGSKPDADAKMKADEHFRKALVHLQKLETAGRLSANSSKLLTAVNAKIAAAE